MWRAVLWTLGIAVALLLPFHVVEGLVRRVGQTTGHVVLFAGSTWLWLRAFPRAALAVVAAMVVLALGTETLQMAFTALGRGAQTRDLVADGVGIVLGLGLWVSTRRWLRS